MSLNDRPRWHVQLPAMYTGAAIWQTVENRQRHQNIPRVELVQRAHRRPNNV